MPSPAQGLTAKWRGWDFHLGFGIQFITNLFVPEVNCAPLWAQREAGTGRESTRFGFPACTMSGLFHSGRVTLPPRASVSPSAHWDQQGWRRERRRDKGAGSRGGPAPPGSGSAGARIPRPHPRPTHRPAWAWPQPLPRRSPSSPCCPNTAEACGCFSMATAPRAGRGGGPVPGAHRCCPWARAGSRPLPRLAQPMPPPDTAGQLGLASGCYAVRASPGAVCLSPSFSQHVSFAVTRAEHTAG